MASPAKTKTFFIHHQSERGIEHSEKEVQKPQPNIGVKNQTRLYTENRSPSNSNLDNGGAGPNDVWAGIFDSHVVWLGATVVHIGI
jgi:hypothetical protein